ncbi:MAG: hypothetical protein ACXAEN_22970 [Candidatus Thorarchaeota archaeon]|jgi:hypothetical protein
MADPQTPWQYIIMAALFVGTTILAIWSKVSFAKKADIYHPGGDTKFPTTSMCDRTHRESNKTLMEIKHTIEEMDKKRENSKTEIAEAINRLTHEMGVLKGTVETFINQPK